MPEDSAHTDITETLINSFGYNDLFSNYVVNTAVDEINQLRQDLEKALEENHTLRISLLRYVDKFGQQDWKNV